MKYIYDVILGSLVLFAFTAFMFLICAFLLWDSHVLLSFWHISFPIYRFCLFASFILCMIDWSKS